MPTLQLEQVASTRDLTTVVQGLQALLTATDQQCDEMIMVRDLCCDCLGLHKEAVSPRHAKTTEAKPDKFRSFVPAALERHKQKKQHLHLNQPDIPTDFSKGPVTDIAIIFSGDSVPVGFDKIERSPTGIRADLNKGGRGQFVYLCIRRDNSGKRLPISEILLFFPERNEHPPPGYQVVRRRGVPANLNTGTLGEKVYLCVRRSSTSYITNVIILFPKKGEQLPLGYMRVDRSPTGFVADGNSTTGGTEVYICYQKTIDRLETLKDRIHSESGHAATLYPSPEKNSSKSPLKPARRSVACIATSFDDEAAAQAPKVSEVRSQSLAVEDFPSVETLMAKMKSEGDATDSSNDKERDDQRPTPSNPSSDTPQSFISSPERLITTATPLLCQHIYPLLVACHIRHGQAATQAIKSLEQCLDDGFFDEDAENLTDIDANSLLDLSVSGVCNAAEHGVVNRYPAVLSFLIKVVQKQSKGLRPQTLHYILDTVFDIERSSPGAAQSTVIEIVRIVMDRIEFESSVPPPSPSSSGKFSLNGMAHDLVNHIVDEAVNTVDTARATERIFGCCKSHPSIHTMNFSRDLYWSCEQLFVTVAERNVYQLIATLSKLAGKKLSLTEQDADEQDIKRVNMALDCLNTVLLSGGRRFRESPVYGQQLRRFVCTNLTSTLTYPLASIFGTSLNLMTTLWNGYRKHLKLELALLFQHVLLFLLREPHSLYSCISDRQQAILSHLTTSFGLPQTSIEMFLNFDLDRQDVQQWKIFEQICSTLCNIAEEQSHEETNEDVHQSFQSQAFTTIHTILRGLMDVSGHAHLISRDSKTRDLSMQQGGWEQDEIYVPTRASSSSSCSKAVGKSSVRMHNELQKRNQEILTKALEIAQNRSIKKAIDYLVAMQYLNESARDIASFLRLHREEIGETKIGDYLGEGDGEFKDHIRLSFVRAMSFVGMSLVESLRHFLTHGGFRLPGEAQKIERMVEAFARSYWEAMPEKFSCSDTVMVLAYSCIMLNTDLHNPQVKKNKMSKDQFIRNNRGIDQGRDVSGSLLEAIYDDILGNPIAALRPLSASSGSIAAAYAPAQSIQFRLLESANQAEKLMKGLSHSKRTFNFVGIDANISPELIRVLFERVWFHFQGLISHVLHETTQSSLPVILMCIDFLQSCLSICLFLNMPSARQAFVAQLVRLKYCKDYDLKSEFDMDQHQEYQSDSWYIKLEKAVALDDPWYVISDLHLLFNELKEQIQKTQDILSLQSVCKRLNRSAKLLENTKMFLREGDLMKKCRSKYRTYRFFLFNDQLIYADKSSMSGKYNPHNSLRLRLTRVTNVPDTLLIKHAFQILNPVKSFMVMADSEATKNSWLCDIQEAIHEAHLKNLNTTRRLSIKCAQALLSTLHDVQGGAENTKTQDLDPFQLQWNALCNISLEE